MLISTTVLWLILFYSDWLQEKKILFRFVSKKFFLIFFISIFLVLNIFFNAKEFCCMKPKMWSSHYNLFVPANSDLSETEYEVDLNSLEISQVLKRQKKKNSTVATESQLPQVKALMEKFIFIPLLVNF